MGEFRTVTYEVHNPKIKQNQSVRFAVLADVHGSEFGTDNCDLQAKIRENLPDAILVAGDMVVRKDVSTLENARKLLISLAKDFPVFYGLGNHESKMKIEGYPCQSEYLEYEQSLRKAGVHILTNEKYEFQAKGTSLVINGLELPLEYYHKPTSPKLTDQAMEQLMGKPEPDAVNILLAHSPKYGRTYFNWGADLILSGHYHGGVLRFSRHIGTISPQLMPFPRYCCGDFYQDGQCMIVSARAWGTHHAPSDPQPQRTDFYRNEILREERKAHGNLRKTKCF